MKNFWKWYNDKYGLAEFKKKDIYDDMPPLNIPIDGDPMDYQMPFFNCAGDLIWPESYKLNQEEEDNESRQD